jgi:hypothetical protein
MHSGCPLRNVGLLSENYGGGAGLTSTKPDVKWTQLLEGKNIRLRGGGISGSTMWAGEISIGTTVDNLGKLSPYLMDPSSRALFIF